MDPFFSVSKPRHPTRERLSLARKMTDLVRFLWYLPYRVVVPDIDYYMLPYVPRQYDLWVVCFCGHLI